MLDKYRSIELTLDLANQYVPNTIVTSGIDCRGRTLDLTITDGSEEADLTECLVWFCWHHRDVGNSGIRKMSAVDATKGKFQCNFPTNMAHLGVASCCIVVTNQGPDYFIPSLEFKVTVQSAIFDGHEADTCDDFSDLQEAMGDLRTLLDEGALQIEDSHELFVAALAKWDEDYKDKAAQQLAALKTYIDTNKAAIDAALDGSALADVMRRLNALENQTHLTPDQLRYYLGYTDTEPAGWQTDWKTYEQEVADAAV